MPSKKRYTTTWWAITLLGVGLMGVGAGSLIRQSLPDWVFAFVLGVLGGTAVTLTIIGRTMPSTKKVN